jgi:hypothetical protein
VWLDSSLFLISHTQAIYAYIDSSFAFSFKFTCIFFFSCLLSPSYLRLPLLWPELWPQIFERSFIPSELSPTSIALMFTALVRILSFSLVCRIKVKTYSTVWDSKFSTIWPQSTFLISSFFGSPYILLMLQVLPQQPPFPYDPSTDRQLDSSTLGPHNALSATMLWHVQPAFSHVARCCALSCNSLKLPSMCWNGNFEQ